MPNCRYSRCSFPASVGPDASGAIWCEIHAARKAAHDSYKSTTFAEWLESAAEWASPEFKPAFDLVLQNYREMPHDFGMPNPQQPLVADYEPNHIPNTVPHAAPKA